MRTRNPTLYFAAIICASCGGAADVDIPSAILGKWNCDDGIEVTFTNDGRYDWHVPAGSGIVFSGGGDSEDFRVNADGSYSILETWELSGSTLEMTMWGDVDRYSLDFDSATRMTMSGPETLACAKP